MMALTPKQVDALLLEKDNSANDDSPLTVTERARVEAITNILSSVDIEPEQKDEFAFEVITELRYIIANAEDNYQFPIQRDELLKAANKAIKALAAFNELLVTSRAKINGNLSAANAMNPRITEDVNIRDVLTYLDSVKAELCSVKSRKRTQRQGNQSIVGQQVAKFLHAQFMKHFGISPHSGKGRRPYTEEIIQDFDRLCEFLNGQYCIKISLDARSLAWETRKPGRDKTAK